MPSALTSVIVRGHDAADDLRRCVRALARHTRPPWELVAVVDGPEGGPSAYLAGVADAAPFPVRLVAAPPGMGPGAALAAGLAAARGDPLVLLDPACVVADGWLDQLLALAGSDPLIGLAGPMSDAAPLPQRAGAPSRLDPAGPGAFAARWRDERRGTWFLADGLWPGCLLLRRAVLEAAGGLADAADADGLARRLAHAARRAGYRAAVAHDCYVHAGPPGAEASASSPPAAAARVEVLSRAAFARLFGSPDTSGALCGYTPPADTHAVLALLAHARPRRVLEVGTALGHMTANLTEWTPDDATVVTLGLARGMAGSGAAEQEVEAPDAADLGRLAAHFGKGHKVDLRVGDSLRFDFASVAPLDFAFVDGGHDLEHALADSRGAYAALAPGGWLVWHDFGSDVPWVKVREAIDRLAPAETVHHVEGTRVAFLRKGPAAAFPASGRPLRLVWEGDVDGLHSLALVNRALCRELAARGHDLGIVPPPGPPLTPERLPPDPLLAGRVGRGPLADVEAWVRHAWPPRLDPPPSGRWVWMQPWEFGRLPRAWLPALERADEAWAYGRAVRDAYVESGVPAEKVHVVPLGFDPAAFRPGLEPLPLPPGPAVRFLYVGGTIHRKGFDLAVEAFARAFAPGDDVGLVVKGMGSGSFYRGQTGEALIEGLTGRGYHVEALDGPLPEAAMARLYAACTAVVAPYRGEGFALPVLEAMACGTPAIVTGAGPSDDYADAATAYLVPARRVELPEGRVGELETAGRPWLWEPDPDALVEHLRRVASDPAGAASVGRAAAAHVRARFTWSHAADAAEARLRALVEAGPAGPVAVAPPPPPAARPRVSLTMIVRDEEANLPACLESARGLFDEVVVVDTGSTDRTRELARAARARVFDFPWVDDFAAARNAALARATGDYAFWLDADDRIEPGERPRVERLLASLRPGDPAAHVVRCACDPGEDGGGGATVVDHVRLFPLLEGVRWDYRVHEQILPALRRLGVPVRWSDATVRHTGYVDAAVRARKLARDEAILRAELEERPGEPFILFNLGAIAIERGDWEAALGHLEASLAASAPADSIVRKLHALIARAHQGRGDLAAALSACRRGLEADPGDAELWFRRAVAHRGRGEPAEAEACWRRVLTLSRPEVFASVDMGIYGHLTRRNLAALAEERGDAAEARALWEAVLAECPGDPEAAARLAAGREGAP
ncbi:MAG: hypothetical protein KatS3mg108_2566 [Isosphaeraceae bacterium]|jgi:glycosyltransferase involved in cell wall biosynthesis|nr:MAG: hypothetical protein KatS3mg108_2566 [Isosphaeraceae bacterium]